MPLQPFHSQFRRKQCFTRLKRTARRLETDVGILEILQQSREKLSGEAAEGDADEPAATLERDLPEFSAEAHERSTRQQCLL